MIGATMELCVLDSYAVKALSKKLLIFHIDEKLYNN